MIAATAEMADAPPAEAAFGERSRALWPGFAAELETASRVPVGYRRNGALMLELRPATLPPGTAWLDGAAARAKAPMLADVPGALWAPEEAQADSRALTQALVRALAEAGGRLLTGVAVTTVEAKAVVTPSGHHAADAVILAVGAWGGALGLPVTPVKGQMIALACPPDGEIPDPVIWGNGVYLVPRLKERRLLVGATVEEAGFDLTLTDAARNDLRARAEGLLPRLKDWTLVEHWAGLRPRSPDGLPLLGQSANGVFVAGGQYRNGILFAPAIADHLRDLVLGRATVIPEFDPQRFQ
jgi:glycine/D-amino acid oxidase-like deaminating enzyme